MGQIVQSGLALRIRRQGNPDLDVWYSGTDTLFSCAIEESRRHAPFASVLNQWLSVQGASGKERRREFARPAIVRVFLYADDLLHLPIPSKVDLSLQSGPSEITHP